MLHGMIEIIHYSVQRSSLAGQSRAQLQEGGGPFSDASKMQHIAAKAQLLARGYCSFMSQWFGSCCDSVGT